MLHVADFIANWNNNWAKSLLPYHPEYNYLVYTKAVCQLQKTLTLHFKKENGTTVSKTLAISSDSYDAFLQKTESYDLAVQNGLISLVNGNLGIYNNDPYFLALPSTFETTTQYGYRKAVMTHALQTNYIGNETLLKTALRAVVGSPLTNVGNLDSYLGANPTNTLSDVQKDKLWTVYKSLYQGLKTKIKHIFVNLYAMKTKSFNGCIGNNTSTSVTNVLSDNFPQKASVFTEIQNYNTTAYTTNSLCNSASGVLYNRATKRFIPADFGFQFRSKYCRCFSRA